jgi:hypothetical protein
MSTDPIVRDYETAFDDLEVAIVNARRANSKAIDAFRIAFIAGLKYVFTSSPR